MLDGTPRHLRMPFVHREIFVLRIQNPHAERCIRGTMHLLQIIKNKDQRILHIHFVAFPYVKKQTLAMTWLFFGCTRRRGIFLDINFGSKCINSHPHIHFSSISFSYVSMNCSIGLIKCKSCFHEFVNKQANEHQNKANGFLPLSLTRI